MELHIPPGNYVIAVSGGVDSVVLAHMLCGDATRTSVNKKLYNFVIAHFDHGIRADSQRDREFVQNLAQHYNIEFQFERANLGSDASEDTARKARYKYLRSVMQSHHAQAIITAHHQDDALETAVFNIMRGTGRRGMTSLSSTATILRPMLNLSKHQIIAYAQKYSLQWHEDSTNNDQSYSRNYIRHSILATMKPADRNKLTALINDQRTINNKIDTMLAHILSSQMPPGALDRNYFNQLLHTVACELMAAWLRSHDIRDFDRPTVQRLVIGGKTAATGVRLEVKRNIVIMVSKHKLALVTIER